MSPNRITKEQAARFLAINNMALESQLSGTPGVDYTFTTSDTWAPRSGLEIDQAFDRLRTSAESDELVEALQKEMVHFRRMLTKGAPDANNFRQTIKQELNLTVGE